MKNEMNTLIENIKEDYLTWTTSCAYAKVGGTGEVFTEGGSVWGFVVNTENDKKFKKGDILKAAGYAAPARNKARGNIVDGGYTINWTGPLYLT